MKSIMKSFVKTDILENDDAFVIPMISGCFKEISEISFGPNTKIHVLKYKDVIPLNDLKQFISKHDLELPELPCRSYQTNEEMNWSF